MDTDRGLTQGKALSPKGARGVILGKTLGGTRYAIDVERYIAGKIYRRKISQELRPMKYAQ